MPIHKEVLDDLERSPHPLSWTLAIFAAVGAAILLQSLILAGLAGLLLGIYEGNYYGRLRVLRGWRRDLELERLEIERELTP